MPALALCMLLIIAAQVGFAGTNPTARFRSATVSIPCLRYTASINTPSACISAVRSLSGDTGAATPLSLRLMNFTGSYAGQRPIVLLHWTAAVQTDVRLYQVESSQNGVQWQSIGEVGVSAANAADTNHYAFQDLLFSSGDNYYRLKIVARNNSFCYSPVLIVQAPQGKDPFSVFPNPARTEVHVRWEGEGATPDAMELFTFNGNAVGEVRAGKLNDCSFSVAQVPAGLYLLKVHYGDHEILKKVVVSH